MSQADENTTAPRLKVVKLTKSFGEHYALVEVSAQWYSGEVCALLGPNGAGKSTLLNLLSTLMAPSEGEISLDGTSLSRKTASILRQKIGYVGHQTMIYPELTAFENLQFFAKLYACWPSEVSNDPTKEKEWLLGKLDEVGLSDAAHRLAGGFSRGMSQRLTLARALLPSPALLLLDEPFTGLDQAGIQQSCQLILKAKEQGACIILSSHDLDTTERIADKVLLLKRGRLQSHQSLQLNKGPSLRELYQGSIES